MVRITPAEKTAKTIGLISILSILTAAGWGQEKQATLEFAPARSTVSFTLGDVLHTVHGTFNLKSGTVHFDPSSNAISGMIIVDATSGDSGSNARDRKMHKDVLESSKYSEVNFRPDRVEGKVSLEGPSEVQVHGMFGIHGSEHEITVPVHVELAPDHWSLTAHFEVPYVSWGLKDPSTFILRVAKGVVIDLQAAGSNPGNAQSQ